MDKMNESRYNYLGILEGPDVMQKSIKEKVRKESLWTKKVIVKSNLYEEKLIRAINRWTIGVVRSSAGIIYWSEMS